MLPVYTSAGEPDIATARSSAASSSAVNRLLAW
jgi:hypothetical protein